MPLHLLMLLLWLLRASAQPAEKVPVPRASAYNDDQDPASSFANLAPWLSIAGIPFIGWGGYHTYRHLAPYRKQANDPFRSIDDIRERLADEGEDYWEETQGCIHEDFRTVFGRRYTVNFFLQGTFTVSKYQKAENIIWDCIDEVNGLIVADSRLGFTTPPVEYDFRAWQEERRSRYPDLYRWRNPREAPDNDQPPPDGGNPDDRMGFAEQVGQSISSAVKNMPKLAPLRGLSKGRMGATMRLRG